MKKKKRSNERLHGLSVFYSKNKIEKTIYYSYTLINIYNYKFSNFHYKC